MGCKQLPDVAEIVEILAAPLPLRPSVSESIRFFFAPAPVTTVIIDPAVALNWMEGVPGEPRRGRDAGP